MKFLSHAAKSCNVFQALKAYSIESAALWDKEKTRTLFTDTFLFCRTPTFFNQRDSVNQSLPARALLDAFATSYFSLSPVPCLRLMPLDTVDITGIGENATDLLFRIPHFPLPETKFPISSRETQLGGQVATAIMACSKWGLSSRYIGAIGDDEPADLHKAAFQKAGVDARLFRTRNCASRLSYIWVDESEGGRTVLWHKEPKLKIPAASLKREWISRSRLLHLDGTDVAASMKAAQWARSANVPVIADFDSLPPELLPLLKLVDYPIVSAGVPEAITQEADPFLALAKLGEIARAKLVCVTLGAGGALAWDGWHFRYVPSFHVNVVDTTGAGDLFHAGFAFGLLRGWDLPEILEYACAAAGANCTARGARGGLRSYETIEHLRKTLRRNPAKYPETELHKAAARVKRR